MRNSSYNDLPCEQLCRWCVETPHAQEVYAALFCISVNIYKHWIYSARKPHTISCVKFENQQLEQFNVQTDDAQENHTMMALAGCVHGIWHSLKSKATTMSPRLSALPASTIKHQQNSAKLSKTQQALEWGVNMLERHTLFVIISFQPSYHQIIKPVESTLHSH